MFMALGTLLTRQHWIATNNGSKTKHNLARIFNYYPSRQIFCEIVRSVGSVSPINRRVMGRDPARHGREDIVSPAFFFNVFTPFLRPHVVGLTTPLGRTLGWGE